MKLPDLTLPVLYFNEPLLEFGSQQTTAHPKDGLFLYGPLNKPKKTREVRIGVIGTPWRPGSGWNSAWRDLR